VAKMDKHNIYLSCQIHANGYHTEVKLFLNKNPYFRMGSKCIHQSEPLSYVC